MKDNLKDKEVLSIWEDKKINKVDFNFNCGGDSMGDTDFTIDSEIPLTEKEEEIICDYFKEEVYNNVEFYANSDGYYLGERGNVEITLKDADFIEDEDEDYFEYNKFSVSDYSEATTVEMEVSVSKELSDLFKNKVRESFIESYDDSPVNEFFGDCVLYNSEIEILNNFMLEAIREDVDFDIDAIEDSDEVSLVAEFSEDGKIKLSYSKYFIVEREDYY
jgi:hypothetical protein